MSELQIFISLGILFIAIISLIFNFYKGFSRPKLTIELIKKNSFSAPMGISYLHTQPKTKDGVIDGRESIKTFELCWSFNVAITNNSSHPAYFSTIGISNNNIFCKNPEILKEPITQNKKVILKYFYKETEYKREYERSDTKYFPNEINDLIIDLSYKNEKGRNFRTIYSQKNKENKYK